MICRSHCINNDYTKIMMKNVFFLIKEKSIKYDLELNNIRHVRYSISSFISLAYHNGVNTGCFRSSFVVKLHYFHKEEEEIQF